MNIFHLDKRAMFVKFPPPSAKSWVSTTKKDWVLYSVNYPKLQPFRHNKIF